MFLLALAVGLTTAQADLTYQSNNAVYTSRENYVVCSECPAATLKLPAPITPKAAPVKVAPIHIQVADILPKRFVPAPLPPVKETVYFDLGSARLKDTEKKKLDRIDKGRKYSVTGYTCNLGPPGVNERLAKKRAEAVAAYLGKDSTTTVEGKGKCCYVENGESKANRRVEIISVVKKGGENE